ncbi:MAG: 3-hydroxyacyl-CoA dehydrogenase family protein, partial [Hymenobacteraceae bacterium]|nr:3-hydroxyacyl-CoA dehydrogenase family protein [Hymenobacteraceae bacterium]
MNILVLGSPEIEAEFSLKFPKRPYIFIKSHEELATWLSQAQVVFDFTLSERPENIEYYQQQNRPDLVVFCDGVKQQLAELQHQHGEISFTLFGINALPTFLNRPVLEVSQLKPGKEHLLKQICKWFDTEYALVEDRVGMVTPRIICMIINEACYTLQEGTASVQDIDLGMKLGTNYPNGPFEWADKIGVRHVYEVLQAVYEDTKDERYKICPLLKTKYLKGESFLT